MNTSAAQIIPIQQDQFAPVKFELTPESITEMVKQYSNLTLIPGDKESYQEIHAAKMILVKARTGTDKRRKELGADAREWVSRLNSKANELIAPLLPVEEKLKSMLDEEDSREARIEQERIGKIEAHFSDLGRYVAEGKAYNVCADHIQRCLETLSNFEISAVDFQEKTEQAESIKLFGIETLNRILADRIQFETEQAEQAKRKAAQDAEAKKLADERAAFEAVQAQARAEQKKKDDAAALIAAQEAENLRLREEKLQRDRQAIEDQKATIEAREKADAERKYLSDWYDAIEINRAFIPESAILMNIKFDEAVLEEKKAAKARLKADRARAKLIKEDKEKLLEIANAFDRFISNTGFPDFKTDEASKMAVCLVGTLKGIIAGFDESARDLA